MHGDVVDSRSGTGKTQQKVPGTLLVPESEEILDKDGACQKGIKPT